MVKGVSEYIVKQKIIGFALLGSDSANTWVYIKSFGELGTLLKQKGHV